MDVHDRRQLYRGFGDSLVRAVEFAVTPVLFGLIGRGLDGILGLTPWLTIGLVLFAIAGLAVRTYYGYAAAMAAHEVGAPWARPTGEEPPP